MENQQTSFLKSLQIIFGALFMGQILAAIVFYVFLTPPPSLEKNVELVTIFPLIALSLTVAAYFLFNSRRKIWLAESDLDARKGSYRLASLLKWAIFEGTTLMALVGYLVFGENVFFFTALASILHFALHFPSRERLISDLQTDEID